ncbi:MAG: 5'-methylthioadenosine/adenosylhomocysteine nucleosidase [Clostridia bacterium]|nr:5'-methylthioadenosine/adenosylhomocysteine nucleosidase [Clostridia bacterium]
MDSIIGIIAAMDVEINTLKSKMTDVSTEAYFGAEFLCGKLNGKSVVAVTCGVGKVAAASRISAMIIKYSPKVIVCTGVAGGLTPELKVTSLAIAENSVQHDMDTSPLGDPVGMISGINMVNIPSNAYATEILKTSADECGIHNVSGIIASGDQFICDGSKKDYIKSTFNAIACDMEIASMAYVCYINNIPFCACKAISDNGSDDAGMQFNEFVSIAAENSSKVIEKFITLYNR